jgi:nicotinate phosphoribosyltransferase
MAQVYHSEGMGGRATFDLFFREMPPNRNFMISCGLDPALELLETWGFNTDDIDHLAGLGMFDESFLSRLASIKFTGEVRAIPEGVAVFPDEPLLSVTAPLVEAQLLETSLINRFAHPILVASKAARVHLAARGRPFVDFGARRTHGIDASLAAARSAVIGGAVGTSNVEAGKLYGLALSGTMAHSYVLSFDDEASAFRAFARRFADPVVLIDTYDVLEGARVAASLAGELAEEGKPIRGVRIDSGDLGELSRAVRILLDDAGHRELQIVVSGDLDEYRIAELLAEGAPIDAFGVGTRLGTSMDAPALGLVYKMVEDASGPKAKLSSGKEDLPGSKQVFRTYQSGRMAFDTLAPMDSDLPGTPLLETVMEAGERSQSAKGVSDIRASTIEMLESLPESLRSLDGQAPYPVHVHDSLVKPTS